ncbi:MAG: DUF3732 domain-containing protein [Gracilimonas sp.]|uniref:DUF3732 domain-containing protein n=1 Tax=Gracilimonas sp. TaxID=1974203 RepID=UPI0019901DF7|nr:DUF3732 domain-containing protein [Gracilimonas sp.]MBD3615374.1 DUF3732 domain-containing protein [Gracilimonas sp.]
MSFQIKKICLYNLKGDRRDIEFEIGQVNIICGESGTGKSAIIDIVDYCLGRSKFKVFEGVNRGVISWYAILLQFEGEQLFIAKPQPDIDVESQSGSYILRGSKIELPSIEELSIEYNDDSLDALISNMTGITPIDSINNETRSTSSYKIKFKHSKYYLFQNQTLIDNENQLFWRQDDDYIPQNIKDTLPYFLGAVKEEKIEITQKLREAKKTLNSQIKKLREAEAIVSNRYEQGQRLLFEAEQIGLNVNSDVNKEAIIEELRKVEGWNPNEFLESYKDSNILELQDDLENLRDEFKKNQRELHSLRSFINSSDEYKDSVTTQKSRLISLKLFNNKESNFCPVCNSKLNEKNEIVVHLENTLQKLNKSLESVTNEKPAMNERLGFLQERMSELREDIRNKELEIHTVISNQQEAKKMRDRTAEISKILGRISLFLENVKAIGVSKELEENVIEAEVLVQTLEEKLSEFDEEQLLESIFNLISKYMGIILNDLNHEFKDSAFRFDLNKLTVIADSKNGAIPLYRMGSGKNWLGCHLATLLSIHRVFIERNRPVPRFIILDQPSQPFFPSQNDYDLFIKELEEGVNSEEATSDLAVVRNLFDALFNFVEVVKNDFQIIVLEHAEYQDDQYQKAVIEDYWHTDINSPSLIPKRWLQ